MKKKSMRGIWTIIAVSCLMMLFSPSLYAGVVYNINYDGSVIDLSGFIETNGNVGTFKPAAFDAQVIAYSITASVNGSSPFTFTLANSTWGLNNWGTSVDVGVSAALITLSAPTGGNYSSGNAFIIADALTNNAQENLRIYQNDLGFRTPNPPDTVVFETVSTPFILATARPVPLPTSIFLFGTGIVGLVGARLRKRK